MVHARTTPLALTAALALQVWSSAASAQPSTRRPGDAQPAHAQPPVAEPRLIALVPAADAAWAIALGPHGEVYEPDGRGAWIRTRPIATANRLTSATRAGDDVIAGGDGVIFRLADNGWSALRLHQRQRAVLSAGAWGVAAVGRQLFALERGRAGEPAKLGVAPAAVQMIGAGIDAFTIATERGLYRFTGGAFRRLPRAPRRVERMITDRWALIAHGAIDLDTGVVTAWPADTTIEVVGPGAAGALVAVGRTGTQLELLTLVRPTGAPIRSARTRDRLDSGAVPPGAPRSWALRRETITEAGTAPGRTPGDAHANPVGATLGVPPGATRGVPASAAPGVPPGATPGVPPGATPPPPASGPPPHRDRFAGATAVGVVVDGRGDAVVALADGRLAVREQGAWRLVKVRTALPPARPGAAPARAP